ncbi:hypothetical protein KJ705_00940 [Patescibacteria group bacterium]|nr:hypothetical protein [Patescibacteria group bacterium]
MKKFAITCLVIALSTLATTGVVKAVYVLGADVAKVGELQAGTLTVGEQGVGGVTFFNGTIINATSTDGFENPITFGDDVRIDGRVYRGIIPGTSDDKPFVINDNVEIAGTLTVGGKRITSSADLESQINDLQDEMDTLDSGVSDVESDVSDVESVNSTQNADISYLVGAVSDLQHEVVDNRDYIRQNQFFMTCLKDFAEITTYLVSSDFGYCWNLWIAGTTFPPALTIITTAGINLQSTDPSVVLPEFEPRDQE